MSETTSPPPGANAAKDRAIALLKQHVVAMSELSVGMVADGTRAMLTNDLPLAQSVMARDSQLDKFDIDIETEAIRLIATLQPEGADLRTLGAVLKIGTCIDRVGRLGFDIAQNLTKGAMTMDHGPDQLLSDMDVKARAMVRQAIEAFSRNDADLAKAVFALDDDVDALNQQVTGRVIELLTAGGGLTAERLARDILVARHLERVADNACKVAEKAIYAITGERRTEYFPALAHRAPSGRVLP
ncbi:MAG TPA: PhoU domain-containing protein [Thermoplasmata archaeon]|nr:PhoU domain-containing protein [Thermoplasmata archaeon]